MVLRLNCAAFPRCGFGFIGLYIYIYIEVSYHDKNTMAARAHEHYSDN